MTFDDEKLAEALQLLKNMESRFQDKDYALISYLKRRVFGYSNGIVSKIRYT